MNFIFMNGTSLNFHSSTLVCRIQRLMKKSHILTSRQRSVVLLILISVLVLPAIFLFPFHSDVDTYHSMGFKLYQTHGLPYVNSFVANFPGMPFLHEFAISFFGNTVFGFRLFEFLWQVTTLFAIYGVIRFWLSESPSLLACLLYALYYVFGPEQFVGQPDGFVVLLLVLAIGAIILAYRDEKAGNRNTFLLIAGAMYALATVIRPTYALMLFLPIVFLFDPRTRSSHVSYIFAILGFCTVIALVMLPFSLIPNGLHEAYLNTIRYNVDVYSPAINLHNGSNRFWIAVGMIIVWGVIMLIHQRNGRRFQEAPHSQAERRFLIASFTVLFLGIVLIGFAGYHFIPFFSFFIPAYSAFFWEWKSGSGLTGRAALWVVLACSIAILYPWKRLIPIITAKTSSPPFSEQWYEDSSTREIVSFVMQNTSPIDTVDVVSDFSSDEWRIDRASSSRFATVQPLTLTRQDGSFTDYQRYWQSEYVNNMRHAKYYVVENLTDPTGHYSKLDIFFRIPGLKALLTEDFYLDTIIGNYYIYARK
jgi:Dolichyl-phosphate-mannose-protein mannosyltransferase